jgi:tetratricopeptide (TPR) repeat protein
MSTMSIRPPRIAAVWFALLVPALSIPPVLAWGDAPDQPAKPKAGASASAGYANLCSQGNAKYASRDFPGAIEVYRKAIELSPHQGLGHYLLGEAQLAAGNLPEAEASWTRASLEAGEKDPALQARVLFCLADLKERQKKWEDAKAAWQTYLDWAKHYQKAGAFPASATSRQQVMDNLIKQDKVDEVVRQRIAASQDGGVFSDPSKSPPSK